MIRGLSPLDELDDVVRSVSIPVQAVGGLSIDQAIECARRGAPLVVVGAPLVIDGASFRPADGNLRYRSTTDRPKRIQSCDSTLSRCRRGC